MPLFELLHIYFCLILLYVVYCFCVVIFITCDITTLPLEQVQFSLPRIS